MRCLKIVLSLALLALIAPAGASAAFKVAISENNPPMFDDPNFKALGVKQVRLVMSYNAVTQASKGDNELTSRVIPYMEKARAAGIDVLVAIEHARGAAEVCKTNRTLSQCKLPTDADYETNLRQFLQLFPQVKTITPWNEGNHFTQPTSRNPKAAARFTDIAIRVCKELNRGCKVLLADVLDQADSAKAKKPKFKSTLRWIKTYKKTLKAKIKSGTCGIHNYSDVNRFRDTGTKTLMKALGCKDYWFTETGGIAKFGSFKFDLKRQLKATKYMFQIAKKNKKVKNVFVYTWYGGVTPRFDAGITERAADGVNSEPRPAYNEVKKYF
jgi:hypothetical protein